MAPLFMAIIIMVILAFAYFGYTKCYFDSYVPEKYVKCAKT